MRRLLTIALVIASPGVALAQQTTTTEQTMTVTLPAAPTATTPTATTPAPAATAPARHVAGTGASAPLTASSITPVPTATPRATALASTGADPEMLILAGVLLMAGAAGAWFGFGPRSRRPPASR